VSDGVIAAGDDLLQPRFYVTPAVREALPRLLDGRTS